MNPYLEVMLIALIVAVATAIFLAAVDIGKSIQTRLGPYHPHHTGGEDETGDDVGA